MLRCSARSAGVRRALQPSSVGANPRPPAPAAPTHDTPTPAHSSPTRTPARPRCGVWQHAMRCTMHVSDVRRGTWHSDGMTDTVQVSHGEGFGGEQHRCAAWLCAAYVLHARQQ
eukprot:scaffold33934_cov129-Isochrysis_galbana.AAC.4